MKKKKLREGHIAYEDEQTEDTITVSIYINEIYHKTFTIEKQKVIGFENLKLEKYSLVLEIRRKGTKYKKIILHALPPVQISKEDYERLTAIWTDDYDRNNV